MAKKIVGFVKLQVPAGKANPSPPIGPALGQRGLNIMEFCKAFNAQTQGVEPGLPLPVVITAYADKSFTFIIKTPPATVLIKKAVKLDKGSSNPLKEKVGKITRAQLEEIAKTKLKDMNASDVDAAVRTLAGSARSMGITTAPRTTWSDFFGSMPSCTATSIDSSNFAVAHSLTSASALSTGYSLVESTLPAVAFWRLVSVAMIR